MARGNRPQPQQVQAQPDEEVTASSALGYGLTTRQAQFLGAILEQVLGKTPKPINTYEAAIKIGVPEEQARAWARMMLSSDPVRNALHDQLKAQIEAGAATPTRWLAEVAKLALVEPPTLADFYQVDGSLKPPHEWTPEMAAQVMEITSDEIWEGRGEQRVFVGWTKKVKLFPRHPPKLSALEMLAKYHKLIVQTLEVVGKDGKDLFPDDQARADARARETRERMLAGLGASFVADGSLELN